jgi:hypothetical protein
VAAPFYRLVRYPFISPEKLNRDVQMDPTFLKMAPTDSRGMPLVLRAVFHQDGQRMDGWDTELSWFPRAGSVIYNGEWEWIYGPSALTEGHWPVMERFQKTQFCWTSSEEILQFDLAKVELFDLDAEGTGDPTVHDLLSAFMYHYPQRALDEPRGAGGSFGGADTSTRGLTGGTQGKDVMAHILKEIRSTKRGRELRADLLTRAVVKSATSAKTFRAMASKPEMNAVTRHVFAVGRVRKGQAVRDGYKSNDPRLHGRGFVIYWSHAEARDVKSRFEGNQLHMHAGVTQDEGFMWLPCSSTPRLGVEYHAPGELRDPARHASPTKGAKLALRRDDSSAR